MSDSGITCAVKSAISMRDLDLFTQDRLRRIMMKMTREELGDSHEVKYWENRIGKAWRSNERILNIHNRSRGLSAITSGNPATNNN